MYQDDICVRNCELLSRRFLQKSRIYKHITHFPDNSIISALLHFVQFGFFLHRGHRPIYEGGGGRKPKLREEQRNKRHKSSENVQEK